MSTTTLALAAALATAAIGPGAPGPGASEADLRAWPRSQRAGYLEYERRLLELPDPLRLAGWHDALCARPHYAGSEGDREVIETIAAAFENMGLRTEIHEIWPLLARPVSGEVEIVTPQRRALAVQEAALEEDPDTAHPDLPIGFNAWSGSGEATGEVVYANYGRKEDFEKLAELGVDCTGRVVIARYGGNYRGYKGHYAQKAGAAALLIYTDPADSGYMRGLIWPEGGWANEHHIQRGSVKTLPYAGDALTPFAEATQDAERLDESHVGLFEIPIQPLGYGAAAEIMQLMAGEAAPAGWQGGLPFAYRLTGGPGLTVRVAVEQERAITNTANVIGILEGEIEPDRYVVIGSHHDAWGFGASDPAAGTICMMEAARAFSQMAAEGHRPRRSIAFCAWGAEEYGIIGSAEWVEANAGMLDQGAVAYLNLDMSAMGPDFNASSSPDLKTLIADAAGAVPQARDAQTSVRTAWAARGRDSQRSDEPVVGDLGGGSDHVGFWCHLAIPSAGLGSGGGEGTSYHGNYDTLRWYRQIVGEDYEPALMVTRMAVAVASRLANAPLLPLDPGRAGEDFQRHLRQISGRAEALGVLPPSREAIHPLFAPMAGEAARLAFEQRRTLQRVLEAIEADELSPDDIERANQWLHDASRAWAGEADMGRPWYRNMFAAPDETSGYAAWMLPHLRYCVEHPESISFDGSTTGGRRPFEETEDAYRAVFSGLREQRRELERALGW